MSVSVIADKIASLNVYIYFINVFEEIVSAKFISLYI